MVRDVLADAWPGCGIRDLVLCCPIILVHRTWRAQYCLPRFVRGYRCFLAGPGTDHRTWLIPVSPWLPGFLACYCLFPEGPFRQVCRDTLFRLGASRRGSHPAGYGCLRCLPLGRCRGFASVAAVLRFRGLRCAWQFRAVFGYCLPGVAVHYIWFFIPRRWHLGWGGWFRGYRCIPGLCILRLLADEVVPRTDAIGVLRG